MTMHEDIAKLLRERLEASLVEVHDDGAAHAGHLGLPKAGGGHYRVRVIARCFEGKSLVARHRAIYDVLRTQLQHDIHALAIEAFTPQEATLAHA